MPDTEIGEIVDEFGIEAVIEMLLSRIRALEIRVGELEAEYECD
jgi:hypothetical protein